MKDKLLHFHFSPPSSTCSGFWSVAFNHKEKKAEDESFSLLQSLELQRRNENKELDCNSYSLVPVEQKRWILRSPINYLMLNINMITHVALGCKFHCSVGLMWCLFCSTSAPELSGRELHPYTRNGQTLPMLYVKSRWALKDLNKCWPTTSKTILNVMQTLK